MDATALRELLNQGIQAAKASRRAEARALLLRVLEADDGSEPAWLWLSATLDDPSDQLMALERVLEINPRHTQALAGAAALRQRLGQPAAAEPVAATPTPEPEPKAEPAPAVTVPAAEAPAAAPEPPARPSDTLAAEEDPYQCAYCGRQTHPDDERCRRCGHSLLAPGPWHGGGYLYMALIVTGLQLQLALIQALASYLVTNYPPMRGVLPLAELWTSDWLAAALARAVAWAVVVLLLLGDFDSGYGMATAVALLDLIWSGVGYRLGYLPEAPATANAVMALLVFLIGLLAVISQAQSKLRLRVVPDRGLAGAPHFHQRAVVYARQGKWALAALHWRKAISRAPGEPAYYKALGRADIRLGRYAEAVRAFKSGAEAAPGDGEFARLIEKVRAYARNS